MKNCKESDMNMSPEFEDCKPSDVCCSSCVYGTMTRADGPCGGVYKQASVETLKDRLCALEELNEDQITHIQQLIEQVT